MKTYKRKQQMCQEIEDVQELCRLCLDKTEEGIPIFKDGQDVCAAIAMRIMICVGLEMKHEDSLPNMICVNCFEELERYYKFRRKCEVSYHKLKSHILAVKYKDHKDVQMKLPVEDKPVDESPSEECIQEEEKEVTTEEKEQGLVIKTEQLSEVNKTVTDKVDTEEVQIPIQTEVNPNINTFISTILTELGILVRHDDGLVLQDQGIKSFELETGDDEQLMLELVEEDDQDVQSQIEIADVDQSLLNYVDLEIKEESVVLTDAKSKQTHCKGSSKIAGAWCGECGRAFSSRSAAARHGAVHSGARPHACPTCRRAFAQAAVLRRHMLVHLEVRPHRCPRCEKSFTQRAALAAHARAHAPPHARPLALHRCTACDKVFLYASGLSRHMMSHAGRVYECSACDKQFKDRSSLLRHLRHVYHDKKQAAATADSQQ